MQTLYSSRPESFKKGLGLACLYEAMRYKPVGPVIMRKALVSSKVSFNDKTLTKGTNIIISLERMNFDKELWGDDVNVFSPDRFLSGDMIDKKVKCIWNSLHANSHVHLHRHAITHPRTHFASEIACQSLLPTFPFNCYYIFAQELIFMPFGKGGKSCVGSVIRHNFHYTNFTNVCLRLHFCFHLHLP